MPVSSPAADMPDALLDCGIADGVPLTRLFRRTFTLDAPASRAELRLFSTGVYHAWVNGQYLGRGPSHHHTFRWPFDRYDVSTKLRAGTNVVAILFHTPGISLHNQTLI